MIQSNGRQALTAQNLAKLAQSLGCHAEPEALKQLCGYGALIQRWNRKKRIVGSADPQTLAEVHFADAMALAGRLQQCAVTHESLLDVGSGAGLPGFVLSLLLPTLRVALCETSEKRVSFLHHARRQLQHDVEILHEDVHRLCREGAPYDHAVSRATFAPQVWAEVGRQCVGAEGSVWCMLTERQHQEWNRPEKPFLYTVNGDKTRVLLQLI